MSTDTTTTATAEDRLALIIDGLERLRDAQLDQQPGTECECHEDGDCHAVAAHWAYLRALRLVRTVMAPASEPAPVRQWAVQHPDVHTTVHRTAWAALYTLSKLPGGVLVTRMSNVTEWTRETRCVCGPQPKGGHYHGCPAEPTVAEEMCEEHGQPAKSCGYCDAIVEAEANHRA